MKNVLHIFEILWLRLKSKTPVFFRVWGVLITALTSIAAYLNAAMLSGDLPDGIQRKHVLWLNFLVFLFATVTPLLATKDKALADVKTEEQLEDYKERKRSLKDLK